LTAFGTVLTNAARQQSGKLFEDLSKGMSLKDSGAHHPDSFPWLDVLLVSVGLPAIIILGITQTSSNKASPLLGDLSYPIYVLYFPVLLVMSGLGQSVLSKMEYSHYCLRSFIVIPIFAWLAWRFYDVPLRRILTSMSRKGSSVRLPKAYIGAKVYRYQKQNG
jgi:peptidoglycan/LPS O-acetylase OafA/YrhL